jgi:hypothetical protein
VKIIPEFLMNREGDETPWSASGWLLRILIFADSPGWTLPRIKSVAFGLN